MRTHALPLLAMLAGCALGVDAGVLQEPTLHPRGGSLSGHIGAGGGGATKSRYVLSLGLDTRIDIASGGSRWAAGASVLGGVRLPPGFFLDARIGIWRAIVSSTDEAAAVPSFELGGFIPLHERFDPKHPQYGASADGFVVGIREDIDEANYFTVFAGYALFLLPGY